MSTTTSANTDPNDKKRALRACTACRRMKKRCSDSRPCERCVRNKRNCVDCDGTVYEYDVAPPSASRIRNQAPQVSNITIPSSTTQHTSSGFTSPQGGSSSAGSHVHSHAFGGMQSMGFPMGQSNSGMFHAPQQQQQQHMWSVAPSMMVPSSENTPMSTNQGGFSPNFSNMMDKNAPNNVMPPQNLMPQQPTPQEMTIINELVQIKQQMQNMLNFQAQNPFVLNFHNPQAPAIMMRFSSTGHGKPRIITCNVASEQILGAESSKVQAASTFNEYYGFGLDPTDSDTKEHIHLIQQFMSVNCDEGTRTVRIGKNFFKESFVVRDRIFYATYTPVGAWNDGLELFSKRTPLLSVAPTIFASQEDLNEETVKMIVGRIYLRIYNLQQQMIS